MDCSPTFEASGNDLSASIAACIWRIAYTPGLPTVPDDVLQTPEHLKENSLEMVHYPYSADWLAEDFRFELESGLISETLMSELHYVFCGHDYEESDDNGN